MLIEFETAPILINYLFNKYRSKTENVTNTGGYHHLLAIYDGMAVHVLGKGFSFNFPTKWGLKVNKKKRVNQTPAYCKFVKKKIQNKNNFNRSV